MKVAKHLVLGMVLMEDRVSENVALAGVGRGKIERRVFRQVLEASRLPAEDREQLLDILEGCGFIESDADVSAVICAEIESFSSSGFEHPLSFSGFHRHPQRVEERVASEVVPFDPESLGE